MLFERLGKSAMFSFLSLNKMPTSKRVFCLVFTALLFCSLPAKLIAADKKAVPLQVIVAPVVENKISDRIEALGTALANESVNITANVSEKVKAIHFNEGQEINAGDVLVELEHAEELADLQQAKALLGDRKLTLNRLQRLGKNNLASVEELDRARLGVEQAQASIAAIQARINDRVIRAPFSGKLGLRNISVGSLVESGKVITTLDDLSQIKIEFSVPSVFLSRLKPGLEIEARAAALGDTLYKGTLRDIDSRVDPVSRSIKLRAVLPNEERSLIPGILMQLDILSNTRMALVIPEAALLPQGQKQFVMRRINKDGKDTVEKARIEIGTRFPGKVEVLSGLTTTDQVVTHGSLKLRPGGAIKILAVDDGSIDITTLLKNTKPKNNNTQKGNTGTQQ